MSNRPHCRQPDACEAKGQGHCKSCAGRIRVTPAYRERMREAKHRSFAADPAKLDRARAAAQRNLTLIDRSKPYTRRGSFTLGLTGPERLRYRRLRRTVGPEQARALIDRERLIARADHTLAAAFLRRLAPLIRCNEQGQPDPVGTHWRYGRAVKTREQVIDLALTKGWRPEELPVRAATIHQGEQA